MKGFGIPLLRLRNSRLLALFLVLVLSLSSLPAHASMDACLIDCTPAQVEMLDTHEGCAACAALTSTGIFTINAPDSLAIAPLMAVDVHTPLPPRRPPKA
ncbi:hypothetical protein VRRI112168_10175 [Vreelandella rituensis]|uniref:DUF2946 domain-containing protein n=1 Tax=Vreelandella rituensis TaxID=2282306 RepID=A0A368U184_9GAMM|nr:hypothetical protein [Halomonas rituensis]RCV90784.1 hypothetical protein DU506_10740 [Halomonas rituensis]